MTSKVCVKERGGLKKAEEGNRVWSSPQQEVIYLNSIQNDRSGATSFLLTLVAPTPTVIPGRYGNWYKNDL